MFGRYVFGDYSVTIIIEPTIWIYILIGGSEWDSKFTEQKSYPLFKLHLKFLNLLIMVIAIFE